MDNKTINAVLGVAMLSALPAISALAADLNLSVDNGKRLVAVTNTLQTAVVMKNLVAHDGMNLPLYAKLGAGATVNVPLRFNMPSSVANAVAEVDGLQRYLTVDIK